MQHAETVGREYRPFMPQKEMEIVSQGYIDAWREYDDGFDFPLTARAGRERFPASLFRIVTVTLLALVGWEVISSILT